ncbi:MAG: cupin domain-containing protein [Microbacteriaceae bacterium]
MILEPSTVVAALQFDLPLEAVPEAQVVSGTPSTGALELGSFGGSEFGVWEMTPGAMRDVETDEVFVVLAGSARIDFTVTGESIEIGPGFIGRFNEGTATVWTVAETLRKVYLT